MKKRSKLLLFSGGQDSVTLLYMLVKQFGKEDVCCISFVYGDHKKQNIICAKKITNNLKIKHEIFNLSCLNEITKNKLIRGRNSFFLQCACMYAEANEINEVYIGLTKDDYDCYNDCKPEFIDKSNDYINFSQETDIAIKAPLIYKTKKEIWMLADELGIVNIIKEKTYSCWNNRKTPCGECYSCKSRQKGYEEYLRGKQFE